MFSSSSALLLLLLLLPPMIEPKEEVQEVAKEVAETAKELKCSEETTTTTTTCDVLDRRDGDQTVEHKPGITTFNTTEQKRKWIAEENWRRRVELAVAYRALEKYGMHEGVCNHATAMAPTLKRDKPVMLLVPYGLYWSRVTPKCFIGLDVETGEVIEGDGSPEVTAHSIHRAVYRRRPDVQAVVHTHPTYATALTVLKDMKLKMYHQNSMRFVHNLAYDEDYGAISNDENEECDRIATKLGHKEVLLMGHHGLLTAAGSVALAFDLHYYFEQAAKVQVLAYQTNREMKEMRPEVVEAGYWQIDAGKYKYADAHLNALKNVFVEEDPEFFY